jgi:hypothetical protein
MLCLVVVKTGILFIPFVVVLAVARSWGRPGLPGPHLPMRAAVLPRARGDFSTAKSEFLTEAKARGFVFQCTDEAALDELCASGLIAGYAGFDLTADSLVRAV